MVQQLLVGYSVPVAKEESIDLNVTKLRPVNDRIESLFALFVVLSVRRLCRSVHCNSLAWGVFVPPPRTVSSPRGQSEHAMVVLEGGGHLIVLLIQKEQERHVEIKLHNG